MGVEPMTAPSVDGLMMLAFEGFRLPDALRASLSTRDVAGFTLFRHHNVHDLAQARSMTADIQQAVGGDLPVLIAIDQEGGQLIGLGDDSTPFPGNMALGAVGDAVLAERVGRAVGRELRAVGANVNYAPVCDAATDPANPSLGIRSFGEDPVAVARLAAAFVRGLQGQGVAATLKHFPGKGEAGVDPHLALPTLDLDRERLDTVELVPFRSGLEAGAKMVMVGHYALPRVTGREDLPTSLSRDVVHGLIRRALGFDGVVITDALDMKAVTQGPGQAIDAIAAVRAGNDLLLCSGRRSRQERIRAALEQAVSRRLVDESEIERSTARVAALRRWVAGYEQPAIDEVGCADHRALAREVARRSITLVRDDDGLLPLRLPPSASILAVMPRPGDLTLADTSSMVVPTLAGALRRHHPNVDELLTSFGPGDGEIEAAVARAVAADLVVVGTIAASLEPRQAALVRGLLHAGAPTVTVAMRTPFDLATYPIARTHVCTYGILQPTMEALADALFGRVPYEGRLPASIPSLYPTGHGLTA